MSKKKSKPRFTEKKRKELKRIRSFIRRAEKRGFEFESEFKSSLADLSTQKLQRLTPRDLYGYATYVTKEGSRFTGYEGRYIERGLAAQRAKETRRKKREAAGYLPEVNDIVYQNIVRMINDYPSSDGSQYLRNLLNSEIKNYGYVNVVNAMNESPEELIKMAEEIIYYELTSGQLHTALRAFSELIRSGVIMTKEESKEFEEITEGLSFES